METLSKLAEALAAGTTTSQALVESALARIDEPSGEGAHVFRSVYREAALTAARQRQPAQARHRRLAAGGHTGVDQGLVRCRW